MSNSFYVVTSTGVKRPITWVLLKTDRWTQFVNSDLNPEAMPKHYPDLYGKTVGSIYVPQARRFRSESGAKYYMTSHFPCSLSYEVRIITKKEVVPC